MPLFELIYDSACPNFGKARDNIYKAIEETGIPADIKEWERSAKESPGYVRDYGSPTILLDGRDVSPSPSPSSEGAPGCRVYNDANGNPGGAPSVDIITAALLKTDGKTDEQASGSNLDSDGKAKKGLAAVAPFGIAALVPFACPACWPAYIGLMASLGIGVTGVEKYLFPLTAALLLLALAPLFIKGKTTNNYNPFYLGAVAALITLVGMFAIIFEPLQYTGIVLLVAASIWNFRAGKKEGSPPCPACAQNEVIS
ncbi:hypothetical protein MNBD_NITROSPINAE02-1285 [hydrothermal vent metagenome]|uniref:Uncharacterized protein n=1 Tax=hydrothermal vent metagenome TaxID=652676 RepID=A0A3B1BII1_9ZZZZ